MSAQASPCSDTQPLREISEIFLSVREPGRTPTHRARRIRSWLTLPGSRFRGAPLTALEVHVPENQVSEIVQRVVWTSDVGHEHLSRYTGRDSRLTPLGMQRGEHFAIFWLCSALPCFAQISARFLSSVSPPTPPWLPAWVFKGEFRQLLPVF